MGNTFWDDIVGVVLIHIQVRRNTGGRRLRHKEESGS